MMLELIDTANASVVEKNVNAAIQIDRGLHHVIHFGRINNIHGHGDGFTAKFLYFCGQVLQTVLTARGQNDLAAFFCKE